MAKALIGKYPDKKFVFVMAGDGPKKNSIKKIINDLNLTHHVKFLGHINNVSEYLSALDILVLSSDSKEGVPQSVMQGLFMNKPVVATNSGSTKDLLFDNNFKLVNTNDTKALIDGVSFYLDNKKCKDTRKKMLNMFSKKIMVEKIIHVYKLILL
tara:strand:- start:783 stop:1247 length:465 start_codon:yes stop_codon:yes gene_type:complete